MADAKKRIILYQEKTTVDNSDYVLIDSATDGTHKYQLSRIPAQASAEVAAAVAAEQTARQNADSNLQTSINNEKTAREAYGFSVVNGILNVTYTTTEVGGE